MSLHMVIKEGVWGSELSCQIKGEIVIASLLKETFAPPFVMYFVCYIMHLCNVIKSAHQLYGKIQ